MHVTLYTKPGCTLCETAHLDLLDLQQEFGFDLVLRDITGDESLQARYFLEIPVVEITVESTSACVELKAPISQIELRRQLKRLAP